uniref:Uncharacterized protein n=1 Tax=Panagrolaimus sp. PS1159 TaxID=55785 RepID=A0AC35F2J8_9BILA
MAPQPSGGTSSAAKPPAPTSNGTYNFHRNGDELRCRCCPYGFHIDLDFVKFAENVTAGNDQAHKWNTQPRRTTRRRGNYSVDESARSLPRQIITRDTNSFDTPDEWLKAAAATSPIDSNMSQSTIGGFYSGADDDFSLPTYETSSYNNYLAKNKSDSIVARLIGELNGINNAQKPPIPPPISSSTPYPGQDFIDHKPQKSWHGATSANSEIHEILSRQQPTYSTTREVSKTVTSAPSSPTPVKTYHSAVAQSAGRKAQSATTSKQHHQQQQPPITPPRRYFDSARPRVLSPEPAARDRSLAPTALRTSNFHSRTYYSPTSTTERNHVPYRGATTSSLSTGLDFNSFASVRRQRTTSTDNERNRTLSPIYNRQTGGSRLDGYTSDAEYRSTYRYEMSPPPLPPRSQAPTTPTKMYSYGNSTILKRPESTFENLEKPETVERGVDAYEIQKVPESPKAVLQHQESQTRTPPEQKHVSTVTEMKEENEEQQLKTETQITQTSKIDQSTIGCNTDKIPEEPFQPEKSFSVEFQFAIGHGDKLPEDGMGLEKISTIPKETKEQGSDAIKTALFSIGMNTDKIVMVDKACMPMPPPVKPKTAEKGIVTDVVEEVAVKDKKKESATIETQTEHVEEVSIIQLEPKIRAVKKESTTIETQTDNEWVEEEIERRIKAEKAERKSVDKITETEEEDAGEFIMITCTKCEQSSITNGHEHYEKIVENENEAEAENEEVDPNHTQTDSIGDHESGFSNSSTDLEEFEKLEQSIQEQEKLTTTTTTT